MVIDNSIRTLKTATNFTSDEGQPEQALIQGAASMEVHQDLEMQLTTAVWVIPFSNVSSLSNISWFVAVPLAIDAWL
jgi:hypothetical protein